MDILELKAKRLGMGLTLQEVADIMYVTKQHLSYIETLCCDRKAAINYYRLVIEELWSKVPDEEKEERLHMGLSGISYKSKAGQKLLEKHVHKKEEEK